MNTVRPARPVNTPRRAKCFTAGLLIAVLGAAQLAARDGGPPALRDPVAPAGWRIAFAPPAGWSDEGESLGPMGGRFLAYRSADRTRVVAYGRIPAPGAQSAEKVCIEMISQAREMEMLGGMRGVHVSEVALGDWIGTQFEWVPEIMGQVFGEHVYLLGVMPPEADLAESDSEVYVIELRTPPPLRLKDEELWKLIVHAVQTRTP